MNYSLVNYEKLEEGVQILAFAVYVTRWNFQEWGDPRWGVVPNTTAYIAEEPEWTVRGPAQADGADDYAILENGEIIADVFGRSSETVFHNSLKNAHTMSASRVLLSVLKRAVEVVEEGGEITLDSDVIKMARTAIEKAEGKPC